MLTYATEKCLNAELSARSHTDDLSLDDDHCVASCASKYLSLCVQRVPGGRGDVGGDSRVESLRERVTERGGRGGGGGGRWGGV